eukprot:jgi/Mesvir1/26865/Mv24242-RA.1
MSAARWHQAPVLAWRSPNAHVVREGDGMAFRGITDSKHMMRHIIGLTILAVCTANLFLGDCADVAPGFISISMSDASEARARKFAGASLDGRASGVASDISDKETDAIAEDEKKHSGRTKHRSPPPPSKRHASPPPQPEIPPSPSPPSPASAASGIITSTAALAAVAAGLLGLFIL